MTAAEGPPATRRTGWLVPTLGVIISAALLYWATRGVDFGAALEAARSASPALLLASVLAATSNFGFRVPRWQQLLQTEDGMPLPAGTAWHGIAIGFMANNLVPRSGEVLRAWVASRLSPVSFTSAFSSVAVERIFDGLVLTALLAISLFSPTIPDDARYGNTLVSDMAIRAGIVCLVLLAGALLVLAMPALAERWIRRLVPWPGLAERLAGLLHGVVAGLSAMRSPRRLAVVMFWSVVVWLVNGASFWLGAKAFGIDIGFSGALLLQGVLAFGVALPSTPGYVGIFEGLIVGVLAIFAIEPNQAFAFAVTYHVSTFIPVTLLGALSVVRTPISFRDLRSRRA